MARLIAVGAMPAVDLVGPVRPARAPGLAVAPPAQAALRGPGVVPRTDPVRAAVEAVLLRAVRPQEVGRAKAAVPARAGVPSQVVAPPLVAAPSPTGAPLVVAVPHPVAALQGEAARRPADGPRAGAAQGAVAVRRRKDVRLAMAVPRPDGALRAVAVPSLEGARPVAVRPAAAVPRRGGARRRAVVLVQGAGLPPVGGRTGRTSRAADDGTTVGRTVPSNVPMTAVRSRAKPVLASVASPTTAHPGDPVPRERRENAVPRGARRTASSKGGPRTVKTVRSARSDVPGDSARSGALTSDRAGAGSRATVRGVAPAIATSRPGAVAGRGVRRTEADVRTGRLATVRNAATTCGTVRGTPPSTTTRSCPTTSPVRNWTSTRASSCAPCPRTSPVGSRAIW